MNAFSNIDPNQIGRNGTVHRSIVFMSDSAFDYVIVGSGSAGGVVTARLSEDPSVTVLLLEAGPVNRSPILHVPAAARYAFNASKFNWGYVTEPEPELNGRRIKQPRGRVLGGSSSINGLVYLRGNPLDYEGWAEAGATGWSYADVLPYFKRQECWIDPRNEYQGRIGPIRVSTPEPVNPLSAAFVEAGRQAGYGLTDDVNGYSQEGFGRFPMNAAQGYRWSTAHGHLRQARGRRNLEIRTGSVAERIEFKDRRAIAVHYRHSGRLQRVIVRRETVICAGPFNAPKLLMHSGIGPAAHLREFGIDVVHDLPGVGENLMDHQISAIQMESKLPVTLYKYINLPARALSVLRWLVSKDGPLASNHFETGAFVRSQAGVRFPDIQLYLFPIAVHEGSKDFFDMHGFQVQISPQRSLSRGHVRLQSADPGAPPLIRFNYMTHRNDWIEFRRGFRLAREVLGQPAMDSYRGTELLPGGHVRSDDEIDAYVRDHMHSSYHPCGTCRMGADPLSVVDPECRVIGIEGLRVADSSIMPLIPSCNLNAPSIMIGEKASDLIAGKRLSPLNLDYYVDEHWRTRQRPGSPERIVMS